MRERPEHQVLASLQRPGSGFPQYGFCQIEVIIIVEEFLTSAFCHPNLRISKKDGLYLSQEDLSLIADSFTRHPEAAEIMFPLLTQIFIYETLPALTNINSTSTQASFIYTSSVDHQIIRRNDMKRLLTAFTITFVAAVWMIGTWLFFNSIAVGAQQGSATPAVADVSKTGPQDADAAECESGHHWKHWGRHGHHHLWKELNLTDAQKKEMFSIRLEERAKIKPLVQKLKAGRDQLRALPMGQFDEAKVRAVAKGQADIRTELIVEKQRMKSRIYGVLTQEQRAKVEQMREKWKSRHEKEQKDKD